MLLRRRRHPAPPLVRCAPVMLGKGGSGVCGRLHAPHFLVCACVCVRVRACVCACVRVRVRACVCVCVVRVRVRAYIHHCLLWSACVRVSLVLMRAFLCVCTRVCLCNSGFNVLDFLVRMSRSRQWGARRGASGGAVDPGLDIARVVFDARVFTAGLLSRPDAPRCKAHAHDDAMQCARVRAFARIRVRVWGCMG